MAKLRVALELLVNALFQGAADHVIVSGAGFDTVAGVVVLDISGHDVPEGDGDVLALMTKQYLTVRFERPLSYQDPGLRTAHPQEGPKA